MKISNLHLIVFFSTVSLLFSACKGGEITPTGDYSANLTAITNDVIVSTYQDLDNKAGYLVSVLNILEATPTVANLDAAKQAWRDARLPWEQSEGFLYGPVDIQGIDPSLDSWPVNTVDLDNVLNGGAALTPAYITTLDGTLKGFHTIEYLLFGLDGNKPIADFDARQFEYLSSTAQVLKDDASRLYTGWIAAGGNFARNFIQAGTVNSIYPSQKAALQEVVNGMIAIADEVGNGKIYNPFSQQDVTLEESRFSANSKFDFSDNIRSIRNVYLGSTTGVEGQGLQVLVAAANPALDALIREQIEAAITAIQSIPGTFTTAIFNYPTEVLNAQTVVRNLQDLLQGQLLPFVQTM